MQKFCYRDKQRPCDESCEAFHSSVLYGLDSRQKVLSGECIELGIQSMIVSELRSIKDAIKKRR
ncbi:hypothetical protein AUJ30_02100 [Candidatus Wolfebacteria bacterium CG1_02_39_135]|uniref:Uncharacterized protein n=3 Tax=Candidatus Wolfeibacteriota TaxID=1752735 RepID=A0A2M7Q6Z9_9BACT|nr:MAG: hypothetical protein AUJ30_02100 [Candidatus Wolfebacteria bacterium CG1_02_39_135]PIY58882.1 MAG: hypothetical protein COY97_01915 [Candidatus Wolfebacteria bacterium CG_4_10_14_0_8_um_filter_39_64]PJB83144.1 MAG: hypothetical protein CO087_02325 [Candidatus Wolfebacteria bacterium CG_4_9_14_0_8_um_filter_39_46]